MPVQINISCENAIQAIEEFATLSAAFVGAAPASATPSVAQSIAPQQQQFVPVTQPSSQQVLTPAAPVAPAQVNPQQGYSSQPAVGSAPVAAPMAPPPGAVPTTGAPTYTVQQLGVAAGPIVDAGGAAELTQWMQQRGADALTKLDPAYYGDFAALLRSKGAKI